MAVSLGALPQAILGTIMESNLLYHRKFPLIPFSPNIIDITNIINPFPPNTIDITNILKSLLQIQLISQIF